MFGAWKCMVAVLCVPATAHVPTTDARDAVAAMRASPANCLPATGVTAEPGDRKSNRKTRSSRGGQSKKHRRSAEKFSSAQQRAFKALRKHDYALAETLLATGLKSRSRSERDGWRLVEAELEMARKHYAKAGLAAMRVVILRPKSRRVGSALYWAGRAYEGLGRPAKAAALYRSCAEHKTTDAATRRKAQKRLSKLKKKQAG